MWFCQNVRVFHNLMAFYRVNVMKTMFSRRFNNMGSIWRSDLIWCSLWSDLVLFSSCVHLSTTNVEHLGSITSLEVMKAQSVRNEFTCSCSFLAWLLVSNPWFLSLMLDGEFLTLKVVCMVGMSSLVPHFRINFSEFTIKINLYTACHGFGSFILNLWDLDSRLRGCEIRDTKGLFFKSIWKVRLERLWLKTGLTLNLILRFNQRLGGYSI